ncbi:hypothetical protein CONPUDRAFT_152173 [Coniophora puteana RWD-64-598 SS2]|uniref:Uncharacterized protein n=1 Tax=Coniophora puteana (strain RWD-64-598) TaxID=741705 RepID=A0A5M3MVD1_CONPW|nr:uncharacterized protein CONPUDRAFT_152173 [Coniophora puteana RWD-64-598 SS2]EIW83132.1 hypothetical protein CONPUDRAFT_152173 [Coniophora puteana RWD-64-598 SS2]
MRNSRKPLGFTATAEIANLNEPHKPHENAIKAFNDVLDKIKEDVITSRHRWNKHEPKMWSRAGHLTDAQLTSFTIEEHLVEIRSGYVSYGTIIFGKIKLPAVNDELGEGFLHVRIHDPGEEQVLFHSIHHIEGKRDEDGHPHLWRAIMTADTPLEFFEQ